MRGDFHRERVEALRQNSNVLQKLVVENHGRNRDEKAGGGGQKRFRDAGRYSAKTGGVRVTETGEGVNDAPDRTEQADERRYGAGRCEPRHTFFGAADFFGGSDGHVGGDSLKALQLRRLCRAGSVAHLALELAVARGIDRGERRARCGESLRIRYTARCAKDPQEIIALATDAAEESDLLKNHGPGNDGKQKKNREDDARNPTGVLQNVSEVDQNDCREQIDDVSPQYDENFTTSRTVAHANR